MDSKEKFVIALIFMFQMMCIINDGNRISVLEKGIDSAIQKHLSEGCQ